VVMQGEWRVEVILDERVVHRSSIQVGADHDGNDNDNDSGNAEKDDAKDNDSV
ncbi:MAG: hypothetical protein ACI8W3_003120, partial [Myxococcota bacterium]